MTAEKGKNKGFVILYAVIITTVVLIVGVSLSNIMAKQLVLSSISRNAKVSYYAALSGQACAVFWKNVERADIDKVDARRYFGSYDGTNVWQYPNQSSIICNGNSIPIVYHSAEDQTTFNFDFDIGGQIVSSTVTVGPVVPLGCDFALGKQLIISSEGYNVKYLDIPTTKNRLVKSIYKDKQNPCNN